MTRATQLRLLLTGASFAAYMVALQVHAEPNDHAIVTDNRGRPVLTESTGTCVRTKWIEGNDVCRAGITETVVQTVQAPPPISQDERTVYFPFNQASLTPDARNRLDTLSNDIKSRDDVRDALVAGYADRIGTGSYNERLSQKRAEAVKDYLIQKGIVNASVAETRWYGANNPATNCPAGLSRPELIDCLQKDRRVQVDIDYEQRQQPVAYEQQQQQPIAAAQPSVEVIALQ
jgi:outer membrane protein OmpA-like peptidoglycan-associated protein